jgi:hypothetical protein
MEKRGQTTTAKNKYDLFGGNIEVAYQNAHYLGVFLVEQQKGSLHSSVENRGTMFLINKNQ